MSASASASPASPNDPPSAVAAPQPVGDREAEEAFVGTLFRRLGWLLVAFYLPEDAEQMRELMRRPSPEVASPVLSEAQAAQQVIQCQARFGLAVPCRLWRRDGGRRIVGRRW